MTTTNHKPNPLRAILIGPSFARDFYENGLRCYRQGHLDGALACFNEAIRRNPRLSVAYGTRAAIYYSKGEYDKAIVNNSIVISLGNNRNAVQVAYTDRSACYESRGRYDRTIADATCAIEQGGKKRVTMTAYINRIEGRVAQNDLDGALDDCESALVIMRQVTVLRDLYLVMIYAARGTVRGLRGDYINGLADCDSALRTAEGLLNSKLPKIFSEQRAAMAHANRGFVRSLAGDYAGALIDANEAIRLAEKYPELLARMYYNRGKIHHRERSYPQALADFEAAINRVPQLAIAYQSRAEVYQAQGDEFRAAADLERCQALQVDPPDEVPSFVGSAKISFGWLSHRRLLTYIIIAVFLFIVLRPTRFSAESTLRNDAQYAMQSQNYPAAISLFKQIIALDSQNPYPYEGLCVAQWYTKEYASALDNCTQAINLTPDAHNYTLRASVWYMLKDYANTISDTTTALHLDQQYGNAVYFRGRAEYDQGNLDTAIADYTQAIQLGNLDNGYKPLYERGMAYAAKNDLGHAIADFKQALQIDPNHSSAQYMRQKLAEWGQ